MGRTRQPVPSVWVLATPNNLTDEDEAETDRRFEEILREARNRPAAPMVTEKSIREGAAFMAEFRRVSEAAMMAGIDRKELLTREELVERLGGNGRWVSAALKDGRLFYIKAPSGVDYFPAFFADESIDRRALGRATRVLSALPGPSKFHFFVSKSFTLQMTPLEALAAGRLKEVLTAAAGFAEH